MLKKLTTTFLILFYFINFSAISAEAKDWNLLTQDKQPISLSDYKDKPIILHFWATWCPYCKILQPKLVELQKKYENTGVEIVAISFNEDDGVFPQDELNSRGYTFTTAINGDNVAKTYDVIGTPTTFFINRKNEIIFKSTSSNINDPRLELAMKEIIKK